MPKTDPRVDAYVAEAPAFAQPILAHLRRLVHRACPTVEEAIKWKFPTFSRNGIVCSIAAFKEYCTFAFWKPSLMAEVLDGLENKSGEAMGQFGRIRFLSDLPDDPVIIRCVQHAVRLNDDGVQVPRARPQPTKEGPTPPDFAAALQKNSKASTTFKNFSPSHRREYLEWITEAKRPETRARRVEQAVAWLAEGKSRNWKYQNC